MRTLLPLLVLAACTDLDQDPSTWQAELQLEDVFASDSGDTFPERARAGWAGAVRWQPDGEPWADPGVVSEDRWSTFVVVDPGEQVGVLAGSRDVKLVVYLERIDLLRAPWGYAVGRAAPDAEAIYEDSGLTLSPGLDLEELDHDGDWTLITRTFETLEVESWVRNDDLDEVWAPAAGPLAPISWQGGQALRGGTEILDAPAGDPLATVAPFTQENPRLPWVMAETTGEARRGHLPVRLQSDGEVEVAGWVALDDLPEEGEGMGGKGGCRGGCGFGNHGYGGFTSWPLQVPAHTWVYDAPNGEIVGRTERVLGWSGVDDDWGTITVATSWGQAVVWVSPEDLEDVRIKEHTLREPIHWWSDLATDQAPISDEGAGDSFDPDLEEDLDEDLYDTGDW